MIKVIAKKVFNEEYQVLLVYKKYKLINLSLKRQNKKNMIKHVFKY